MSIDIKEALKTHKQLEQQRMREAAYSVDWDTIVRQILQPGSSSYPTAGPVRSLINTLDPRVLPAEHNHDPVGLEGEDAELLKRPENWTAIARERKMVPFLSSDQLTAKATTEVSSVPLPLVRQTFMADVRRILANAKKRGDTRE